MILRLRRVAERLAFWGHVPKTQTPLEHPSPRLPDPYCVPLLSRRIRFHRHLATGDVHFVLAALSIPIWNWRAADREIADCLAPYDLENAEIHTAWMLRHYPEEPAIPGFHELDHNARRQLATIERSASLSRLARRRNHREHRRRKRLYKETDAYNVDHIVETPFFVDSELTRMVQIADLCAYALRRYVERRERHLFDMLFRRADRHRDTVVGVRHFTGPNCRCTICNNHRT